MPRILDRNIGPATLRVSADGSYGMHAIVYYKEHDPGAAMLGNELVWLKVREKMIGRVRYDHTITIVSPKSADLVIGFTDAPDEVRWLVDHPLQGRLWQGR